MPDHATGNQKFYATVQPENVLQVNYRYPGNQLCNHAADTQLCHWNLVNSYAIWQVTRVESGL